MEGADGGGGAEGGGVAGRGRGCGELDKERGRWYLARMNRIYLFLLPFLCLVTCKSPITALTGPAPETFVAPGETVAYVGTYTRPEGHVNGVAEGIYRVGINQQTGKMGSKTLAADVTNPSFLKLSADKGTLFAVSELAHDDEIGRAHV